MSNTCYDTKPADDCPVCGGILKAQSDKAFKCPACKKRFIKVSKKA